MFKSILRKAGIWLLALALAAGGLYAGAEDYSAYRALAEEADRTDPPGLTITVVEEIPAEEIEESEVPLAMPAEPEEPASRDRTIIAVLGTAGLVLLLTVAKNAVGTGKRAAVGAEASSTEGTEHAVGKGDAVE